jgi:hypothetical protein
VEKQRAAETLRPCQLQRWDAGKKKTADLAVASYLRRRFDGAMRPQKITFGEMRRDMGVRGVLVCCADFGADNGPSIPVPNLRCWGHFVG